jgi:NAD(P)-dependent dehydrogenase (short-subunit alcohol dehydrogenase family)
VLDLELTDRVVVVTGGASNIGRGIVHAFAQQGANVVIVDFDETKGAATLKEALELGAADSRLIAADLSTAEGCGAAMRTVLDAYGSIDVLVNNFGWGGPGLLLTTDGAHWDLMWRMNLGATIACSHAVLSDMKARKRGAIVSLASDAAQGVPNQSVYGAMKAGVVAFTRAIAKEFGRYEVRANAISPGVVFPQPGDAGDKSVWSQGKTVLTDKQIEDTYALQALRRATRPSDIAQAALFLASDVTARQVTGQIISVSGGWWMP